MARAGSCVVGSITRSGRSTTHAAGDHEHEPGERGLAGHPGVEQVEPAGRVEAAAERVASHGGAEGDDVEQRADERRAPTPNAGTARRGCTPAPPATRRRSARASRTARRSRTSTAPGRARSPRRRPRRRRGSRPRAAVVVVGRGVVVAVVSPGTVVCPGVVTGEDSSSKPNDPSPPVSPVGSVVDHETVQSPAGGGLRRAAVTVEAVVADLGGFSMAVKGLPLQPIESWASPICSSKCSTISRRRRAAARSRRRARSRSATGPRPADAPLADEQRDEAGHARPARPAPRSAGCGGEHRFGKPPGEHGSWGRSRRAAPPPGDGARPPAAVTPHR